MDWTGANLSGVVHDATIEINPHSSQQPSAFGISGACAEPLCEVALVSPDSEGGLALDRGAVNCERVSICAHGNGTHTEGIGHVVAQKTPVTNVCIPLLMRVCLLSIFPSLHGRDKIVRAEDIKEAVAKQGSDTSAWRALALRLCGRYERNGRGNVNYTNTNPPYFDVGAMQYIRNELGIQHLLVDLPSIDAESCGPSMPSHSCFFGLEPGCKDVREANVRYASNTITELCDFHHEISDGEYMLSLQIAPIISDASPSKVLFYAIK